LLTLEGEEQLKAQTCKNFELTPSRNISDSRGGEDEDDTFLIYSAMLSR
jgi:hypothetical protein